MAAVIVMGLLKPRTAGIVHTCTNLPREPNIPWLRNVALRLEIWASSMDP